MNAVIIDPELDQELLARAAAGASTRELAEWLRNEKALPSCSHATVARRLVALRSADPNPPASSFREVSRIVNGLMQSMRNLDETLEEIGDLAMLPPDDPRRHGLKFLRDCTVRRQQMLLAQFKYMTSRQYTLLLAHQEQQLRELELMDEEAFEDLEALRTEDAQVDVKPKVTPLPKAPERNKPCPCGSGVKYKKCCGGPNPRTMHPTATTSETA